MPSMLVRVLYQRDDVRSVDADTIDAFLSPEGLPEQYSILFFTGDPALRPETNDVAVVLPELLNYFSGRFNAAVVARAAEEKLRSRFHVMVMPSLVVTRGVQPVGVLAKIRDWSDYVEKIGAWLDPDAPLMAPSVGPSVTITYAGKEISA